MPLNRKALEELLEIAGTNRNLVDGLREFGGPKNERSIQQWRNTGKNPSIRYIDAMYRYAGSIGRPDLKFYLPPETEEQQNAH